MTITRLFVVRHGQSTYNRDGIVSGHDSDPLLTDAGIAQALGAREKLSHIHFDEIYSSDLQRAAHTAALIAGKEVHPDHQLPGLRERKFGAVDGLPEHHLNDLRLNANLDNLSDEERWSKRFADDMESDQDVAERFAAALIEVAEANIGKTILVGSHGGTLRTLLVAAGYAKPGELKYGSIDNGAFAELIYEDGRLRIGEVSGVRKIID